MSKNEQNNKANLVDILEIYHARTLRKAIRSQSRRLHRHDPNVIGLDLQRQAELASYYDTMLLCVNEMLDSLGDNPWSDY